MNPQYFHIAHVFSVFMLFAVCAAAAMAPLPQNRKKLLMFSGIASLVAFLSGFGLAGILKVGFPLWIWVKIFCWLGLSALVGFFFRSPDKAPVFIKVAILTVLVAISMVYLRP